MLEADPGNLLAAPFGQFVLGAFTADAVTQSFGVRGTGIDKNSQMNQVNPWQLRAVPEPSGVVLFGIALALATSARRARPRR